ncbi:hypothetical protein [Corynebacterium belfantii]|uniref:hypothetical protein n=1 Tax=Corynebacterium belfantii TaxID=2014537 RepID=UPI001F3124BA|nr:hypothetical protein [Corynebacterium belfantii]
MDSAPRTWWMLKSAGVQNVSVVDGGLNAWIAAGNRTEFWEDKAASQNKGNITVSSAFWVEQRQYAVVTDKREPT